MLLSESATTLMFPDAFAVELSRNANTSLRMVLSALAIPSVPEAAAAVLNPELDVATAIATPTPPASVQISESSVARIVISPPEVAVRPELDADASIVCASVL